MFYAHKNISPVFSYPYLTYNWPCLAKNALFLKFSTKKNIRIFCPILGIFWGHLLKSCLYRNAFRRKALCIYSRNIVLRSISMKKRNLFQHQVHNSRIFALLNHRSNHCPKSFFRTTRLYNTRLNQHCLRLYGTVTYWP